MVTKGKKFGQGSPPPPFSGNGEEGIRAMPERKHFFMYPDIRAKHLGVKIYFYDMYKTQHFSFFPGIQSKHLREDTYFWDVCECETPHFQFYPDNCAKHLGAAGRIKIQKEGTLSKVFNLFTILEYKVGVGDITSTIEC